MIGQGNVFNKIHKNLSWSRAHGSNSILNIFWSFESMKILGHYFGLWIHKSMAENHLKQNI